MKTLVFANVAILVATAAAHVRLPFAYRHIASTTQDSEAELNIASLAYSVNVTIGTPPQEVSLLLSMEGDLCHVPDSALCGAPPDFDFCPMGSYNRTESSTYFLYRDYSPQVYYDDGTRLSVSEFEDTMGLGDDAITDLTIGLANSGDYSRGVSGLLVHERDGYTVLQQLLKQNHVKSYAYSFSLNKDAMSGNLLFGAVDTSAFDKPLQRLHARTTSHYYWRFAVYISSLKYKPRDSESLEDLGSQRYLPLVRIRPADMLSTLPIDIAETIYTVAGAEYDITSGLATIPCSGAKSSADELVLGLGDDGNVTVRASIKDLVIPREMFPPDAASLNLTNDTCVFAIQSASHTGNPEYADSGWWSLGGVLLRNMYMVFDLVNDEVALAQARFSDKKGSADDIELFGRYGSKIPQSENAEAPDCSDYWDCRDDSDRPDSSYESPKHRLSSAAILLIVLGIVAVLGISVSIIWCLWRRGSCCFKGMKKSAETRRIAAWGVEPIQLSRPPPPYVPGTMPPQFSPSGGTSPTADGTTTVAGPGAMASTDTLQPPPYDQAAGPPARPSETSQTNNPPAR